MNGNRSISGTVSEVAQGVLNNAYRAIPNRPDNYGNNFLDAATDNALTSLYSSSVYKLAMGKYSATDNPLGIWSSCYQQFQYINSFLENLDWVMVQNMIRLMLIRMLLTRNV